MSTPPADTAAAAPPPPPTSSNTSSETKIESRAPAAVVLQVLRTAYSCSCSNVRVAKNPYERFCVFSMTSVEKRLIAYLYLEGPYICVQRCSINICSGHQLLCVPLQALLQDTAAPPPPPPTSTSSETKIESRAPAAVVLQGVCVVPRPIDHFFLSNSCYCHS